MGRSTALDCPRTDTTRSWWARRRERCQPALVTASRNELSIIDRVDPLAQKPFDHIAS
jgi:hypothetical protein